MGFMESAIEAQDQDSSVLLNGVGILLVDPFRDIYMKRKARQVGTSRMMLALVPPALSPQSSTSKQCLGDLTCKLLSPIGDCFHGAKYSGRR